MFTGVEGCRGYQEKEVIEFRWNKAKVGRINYCQWYSRKRWVKKKADEIEEPGKAAEVRKECENIIKTNKKGIVCVAYYQGKVFKKFKDKEKFSTLVNQWKIHKTTIVFKINIYKLCERFPKLLSLSVGLGFFKNYFGSIKEICMENEKEFS